VNSERTYEPIRKKTKAAVSNRHPLRCVLNDASLADGPAMLLWLATMKERMELVGTQSLAPKPIDRHALAPDWVVYEFIPRSATLAQRSSAVDTRAR
jgi:hypothetical protein